jgi:hypothetical protein
MSMNELLALALTLSEQERAALAQRLLWSLSPPGQEVPGEQEWEAACMEEVQQRAERYQRGETTARDWRGALQDIQRRLERDPAHGPANPSGS